MTEQPKRLWRNPASLLGLALAFIATAVGLPLMFADLLSAFNNPYAGILIYLTLPGVAAFGVALALAGMLWERRRRRLHPDEAPALLPIIDFNDARQRLTLAAYAGLAAVILVLLSVTGYRAYDYSDSVRFCGLVCHQVMKPEYEAYLHSPHARVACVACHVGPGAKWFVHAKLTGLYQVYATAFNKYPRPIPTPVRNLRPAEETCAQCHWPAKFFGAQQKSFVHYLTDEKNSPWRIQTLIKIGGGQSAGDAPVGIHAHMNIANEIYYAAADEKRQDIPYIKAVDRKGVATEYFSGESKLSPEQAAKLPLRRMDCVDCHTRPSHVFNTPEQAVSRALEAGLADASLPYLKREAMRLLAGEYKTEAEALAKISQELPEFYRKNYPAVYAKKEAAVRQAAAAVGELLRENVFPEMKADWRAHENNLGHLVSAGCFRCHDGEHKSRDGKVVTKDCGACHTIVAQGTPEQVAKARLQAQPFKHPVDVGVDVTQMRCDSCHNGTSGL
ncbi:MAG: NapC/NirT family cytochrome c [Elusimicrobia bacterium]|nr:NapC/NirT family cytochrome c [Elusimicrobiota bacterium]